MMLARKRFIVPILSLMFAAWGCVAEGPPPEECGVVVKATFRFDLNPFYVDMLTHDLASIRIHVFDSKTSLLTEVIKVNRDEITRGSKDIMLLPGRYTLVCWGSGSDDMIDGGHFAATRTNPATRSTLDNLVPGRTTLENFRMVLSCVPLSVGGGKSGDVEPRIGDFDDLFFAMADGVVVGGAEGVRRVDFNFQRNTSVFNITVRNLGAQRTQPKPDIFVVGQQESYLWSNELDPESRRVRFSSPVATRADQAYTTSIKVHRLEIKSHVERPVTLHIGDPITFEDLIGAIDVVGAIKTIYDTQEKIDRENEYNIVIRLSYKGNETPEIAISINGWEITDIGAVVDEN